MNRPRSILRFLAGPALAVALAGCNSKAEEAKAPPPPPEVGIVVVRTQTVPLTTELVGRTAPFETSDVRPQVSGIVEARLFEEGAEVKPGDTLYRIDPRLFEAAVAEAEANVAAERASEEQARVRANRLRPLAANGVTSAQSISDADAAAQSAAASLAQAEARLRTAEINLRFSHVDAPIGGKIGRSLFTTGALVAAGQTEPLATIQRLDPIFVDIQQSSTSLLRLRRSLASGETSSNTADVRLVLEDGSDYPLPGTLQFTDVTVSADTATVTLRARFPNPDGLLLPGMYVRALLSQSQAHDAMLVPQQAIVRASNGEATALVVVPGDTVERRTVEVDRAIGDRWLVRQGLSAGDRLVVEGGTRLRTGASVKPVPASGPGLDAETPVAEARRETTL